MFHLLSETIKNDFFDCISQPQTTYFFDEDTYLILYCFHSIQTQWQTSPLKRNMNKYFYGNSDSKLICNDRVFQQFFYSLLSNQNIIKFP